MKKKLWLSIVLIVVLIFVVAGSLYFSKKPADNQKDPPQEIETESALGENENQKQDESEPSYLENEDTAGVSGNVGNKDTLNPEDATEIITEDNSANTESPPLSETLPKEDEPQLDEGNSEPIELPFVKYEGNK
ncbi:MAG: hypothetical protein IJE60_07340 [Tyzzerella sp.]|nr:hypothetical protein [Tyzzerella sp.]